MENSVQQRESAGTLKMMVQAPEIWHSTQREVCCNRSKRWTNQLFLFSQLQISATFRIFLDLLLNSGREMFNLETHIVVLVVSTLHDDFGCVISYKVHMTNCFIYLFQRSDYCISILGLWRFGEPLHEIQWWMTQQHLHYYFLINPLGLRCSWMCVREREIRASPLWGENGGRHHFMNFISEMKIISLASRSVIQLLLLIQI